MLSLLAPRAAAGAPVMAIAATSWSGWCGGSSRLFSGTPAAAAAAAEPPPAAGGAAASGSSESREDERAATLPVEQLAKALLAGNARGQLTTVKAGSPAHDQSKVSSSVVPYLCPKGEAPVVLLGEQDAEHLENLGQDAKASLATGHISPPWFIQRLRGTGWLPRRVALLGLLEPLPDAEAQFALDQARKAYASAPALAALLPREERLSSAGLKGFRLGSPSQCVYVDHAGRQHNVAPQDLDACYLDPLALPQHDLLAELNQQVEWLPQLQLFCAAYLGVHTSGVLLTEADRMGFTLFGRPAVDAVEDADGRAQVDVAAVQQQRWRQFRIGSARELRSKQAFLELLQQMKEEVKAATGAEI